MQRKQNRTGKTRKRTATNTTHEEQQDEEAGIQQHAQDEHLAAPSSDVQDVISEDEQFDAEYEEEPSFHWKNKVPMWKSLHEDTYCTADFVNHGTMQQCADKDLSAYM
jgi:hypothetical protein